MTPKEKAKQLHILFSNAIPSSKAEWYESKQCALIAVDEIKEAIFWHPYERPYFELEYWNEVMQEIEKL